MAKTRRWFAQDENAVAGLPPGPNYRVQAGVSDTDDGGRPGRGVLLPYSNDPDTTWLAYDCSLEVRLDAGMALHKPLPQSADPVDTLASVDVDGPAAHSASTAPANLQSEGSGEDVIQRMSTSTYTFVLRGSALRLAFPVPIPGLVSVAGVDATPAEIQRVVTQVGGGGGGVPLYYAEWHLEYYVALPPRRAQPPPADLAGRVTGDQEPPPGGGIQSPYGVPDAAAVRERLGGFFTGGRGR